MATPLTGHVMDHDHRLLGVGSFPWDTPAADRPPVDAGTRLREATHDDREQHSLSAWARPIHRPDEHRALADATVANTPLGRRYKHVTDSAYVPVGVDHASLSAAVGVSSYAGAGGAAHDDASPSSPQAGERPIFGSTTGSAIAAGSEAAPPPSFRAGNGAATSPVAESMTVTTDKTDYAPGSMATFTVAGINSESPVTFRISDLASEPGLNGIVDVYVPFSVTDGGAGDADGLANGTVVAQWQVPANGSATGALLQVTATSDSQTAITTFSDAPNKISTENQLAGTAKSVWTIHGSIANEGDSQIEGFATQISTNAGQTVSFKIDTASSGYNLDIYRLGYYGGNGARLVATTHHSGADNQPNPIFNDATNTVDAGNWSVTDSAPPCRGSTSPS